MANPLNGLHACPTRIDGAPVLFAHKVTQSQCQDRQRGHYHKCFTCVHNNALRAPNGSANGGRVNGRVNGHVNGTLNGHANGTASGAANGRVNGTAHVPVPPRETKPALPKLTVRG
jgi:hypothetical protein